MNEWYGLLLLASILAFYSIPLVMFAILMCLVGRIGKRTLMAVFLADSVLWVIASCFWWVRSCL